MWVPAAEVVGLGRVELPTSPLSGVRSNQLSYRPKKARVSAGRSPRRLQNHLARSPAALTKSSFNVKKGFEDKVERAGRLRRP